MTDDKGKTKLEKKLTSYMSCEDVLIPTTLFNLYQSMPFIECTEIKQVIKFNPGTPYKDFVMLGADMRRRGGVNAEIWKLMLNSAFGKMAQDNRAYTSKIYTMDVKKARFAVSSPNYRSGSEFIHEDETLFIIEKDKENVKHDMPVQGSCMIYGNAKLKMLDFFYNFVDKYISRDDYQLMYTDTDSLWLAFSEKNPFGMPEELKPTPEEAIYEKNPGLCKSGMEDEFEKDKPTFMVMDKWSTRMPGPMKLEFECDTMVALAAKSYFAIKSDANKEKSGCKGIQKSNKLSIETYEKALRGEKTDEAENKGFRYAVGGDSNTFGLQQYVQTKKGVNGTYNKRHLMEDGVHTYPRRWEEDE